MRGVAQFGSCEAHVFDSGWVEPWKSWLWSVIVPNLAALALTFTPGWCKCEDWIPGPCLLVHLWVGKILPCLQYVAVLKLYPLLPLLRIMFSYWIFDWKYLSLWGTFSPGSGAPKSITFSEAVCPSLPSFIEINLLELFCARTHKHNHFVGL